jgi:hypothetical protein
MAANVRSLDEIEARLVVRFPAAFRRAFVAGRRPRPDSRYLLLDLDEIDLAEAWEVPAEAVVVARSLAGGVVGFEILVDATGELADRPVLWERPSEDDAWERTVIGESFDDVLDPRTFEKRHHCAACGSDVVVWPCPVCGLRSGQSPPRDLERERAARLVSSLLETRELVARSGRAVGAIVQAAARVLLRGDEEREAAAAILEAWEEMPEVEELFVSDEELAARLRESCVSG